MKYNRIMAFAAAAVLAAVSVMSVTAADTKTISVSPVLEDFNKNDVNGRVIVRIPDELTANAVIDFSSPEGKSIAYYNSELEASNVYTFDIEGRDNTSKDYRSYVMHISFTDKLNGSATSALDLIIEVPDGAENEKSFTVYDYTFKKTSEESPEQFIYVDEPFTGEKIGDVYYPMTYLVNTGSFMMGDVNGDGKITAVDASQVLVEYTKLTDGSGDFDARKKKAADVNADGKITATDASAILIYYAELTDKGSAKWPFEKTEDQT